MRALKVIFETCPNGDLWATEGHISPTPVETGKSGECGATNLDENTLALHIVALARHLERSLLLYYNSLQQPHQKVQQLLRMIP